MRSAVLSDLLRSTLGSVNKMLSSKNFPENLRALKMVVEELLRGSIDDVIKYDDLSAFLQTLTDRYSKRKLWVDNLIRPAFDMMLFVSA